MSAQRASQLVEAGLWLRLSGDHEGARRLFEQALKLDASNERARQLLEAPPPSASAPGAATQSTMDLDWGMATGRTETPPPIPPEAPTAPNPPPAVPKSDTRPFGAGAAPGTHTVRLGETELPELPDVPRFEDPHDEIQILGGDEPLESSTLVFGMSGVPMPPAPPLAGAPTSSTMVFGSNKGAPPSIAPVTSGPPSSSTLVFGSHREPPSIAPVTSGPPSSSTLVFGNHREPPSIAPVTPGQGPSTLVFGSSKEPSSLPPQSPSTLVFGRSGGGGGPQNPFEPPPLNDEPDTLVFGSALGAPLPPPPAPSREDASISEPGAPSFDVDMGEPDASPEPAPLKPSSTLSFNFDDMLSGPPGPVPSPPIPGDGTQTAWDRSNPRIDISQIGPGEGGGFDLISAAPPPAKQRSPAQLREEVSTLLSGAKDLLDLDDHSGAMELINKALELDPQDLAALKLKDRSESTLQAMFESKLGDMAQTPRVKLKDDEIIWLNLDHRAGFVLAQIDGSVSFEDLFAVSGMSRLDTARILAQLVEEGVISKG